MKSRIINHSFFYIFIILSLTLFLNSCNSDDDDIEPEDTFLSLNNLTVWEEPKDSNPNVEYYIKFFNNLENVFEHYSYFSRDDCYYYQNLEDFSIEIYENSKEKLHFKITRSSNDPRYTIIQCTKINENIIIDFKEYFNTNLVTQSQYKLTQSSKNLEELKSCN